MKGLITLMSERTQILWVEAIAVTLKLTPRAMSIMMVVASFVPIEILTMVLVSINSKFLVSRYLISCKLGVHRAVAAGYVKNYDFFKDVDDTKN
jgi:hypothetical protein